MLEKIDALNKKIERINNEKTKADAQREVWEKRLAERATAYKEQYGVDILGGTFKETKKNLKRELTKVEQQVTEEYELAEKVVSLIENGDIDEAWKLLGGKDEQEEVQEVEEPKKEETLQSASDAFSDLEDDDFFGVPSTTSSDGTFEVDEDDEEEDSIIKPTTRLISDDDDEEESVVRSSVRLVSEDDDDEDEFVTPNSVPSNTQKPMRLVLEEDEDEDEDDGYGDFAGILKGTKFEV